MKKINLYRIGGVITVIAIFATIIGTVLNKYDIYAKEKHNVKVETNIDNKIANCLKNVSRKMILLHESNQLVEAKEILDDVLAQGLGKNRPVFCRGKEEDIILEKTEEESAYVFSLPEEEIQAEIDKSLKIMEEKEAQKIAAEKYTPQFIFDTDLGEDIDDAFALSLLLGYERQGAIDLVGCSFTPIHIGSAYAASALCQASKVYDIPMAVNTSSDLNTTSDYVSVMSQFPHSMEYVDTITLYRNVLTSAQHKVNIVCTGQLTELHRFLFSDGAKELIEEKVDTLYWVGTNTSGRIENNSFYGGVDNPGNIVSVKSNEFINNWPAKLVIIPADVANKVLVGHYQFRSDKNKDDILSKAMEAFGGDSCITGFDVFGALVAVSHATGRDEEWGLSYEVGNVSVYSDGSSSWVSSEDGRHLRVQVSKDYLYYTGLCNQVLGSEFTIRTGLSVQ